MATDETRTKIAEWVAAAPDSRVVETTHEGDRWTTQALEDGEVRYEETDIGGDEPTLELLAAWCGRQSLGAAPRPPTKTTGATVEPLARRRLG